MTENTSESTKEKRNRVNGWATWIAVAAGAIAIVCIVIGVEFNDQTQMPLNGIGWVFWTSTMTVLVGTGVACATSDD